MRERLIRLLDREQLSASKFADLIGVQRSSVSHILSGRNMPSFDFLQKTLNAFPGLNSDWLILGKGEMMSGIPDFPSGTLFDEPRVKKEGPVDADRKPGIPEEESVERMHAPKPESPPEARPESHPVSETGETGEEDMPVRKKVTRVMILYDDNTFTSYEPSN